MTSAPINCSIGLAAVAFVSSSSAQELKEIPWASVLSSGYELRAVVREQTQGEKIPGLWFEERLFFQRNSEVVVCIVKMEPKRQNSDEKRVMCLQNVYDILAK